MYGKRLTTTSPGEVLKGFKIKLKEKWNKQDWEEKLLMRQHLEFSQILTLITCQN